MESDSVISVLKQVFAEGQSAPWDVDHKYKLSSIELYFIGTDEVGLFVFVCHPSRNIIVFRSWNLLAK
jgi:hypothetical protein